MAESGAVYLLLPSPRSTLFPPLIKYLNLDIKISDRNDPEYKAAFPLNKAPAFKSKDGWKLHEAMAILQYIVSLKPESCKYKFYGNNEREKAKVWQWISFANSDCVSVVAGYFFHSTTEEEKKAAAVNVNKTASEFEDQLKQTKYLAGAECTLADIFCVNLFVWGLDKLFDKEFFAKHPSIHRWLRDVCDRDPILSPTLKGKDATK